MRNRMLPLGLACFLVFWVSGGRTAIGSSYYTVTELGPNRYNTLSNGLDGQSRLEDSITKTFIPFPISNINPGRLVKAPLPTENGYQGVNNPQKMVFEPTIIAANVLGDVIAGEPSGASRATPYSNLSYFFYKLQPDQSYKMFYLGSDYSSTRPTFFLDAKDQLLLHSELYDFNNNTHVEVRDLVSHEIQARFKFINGIAMSDEGSIYALGYQEDGSSAALLLTPPVLPSPSPEPSTLGLLLVGVGGLALRHHQSRRLSR